MVSYAFYVICYFNRCGVKAENKEGTEKKNKIQQGDRKSNNNKNKNLIVL